MFVSEMCVNSSVSGVSQTRSHLNAYEHLTLIGKSNALFPPSSLTTPVLLSHSASPTAAPFSARNAPTNRCTRFWRCQTSFFSHTENAHASRNFTIYLPLTLAYKSSSPIHFHISFPVIGVPNTLPYIFVLILYKT